MMRAASTVGAVLAVGAVIVLGLSSADGSGRRHTSRQSHAVASASGVRHLEYVFPDGAMYVYDLDHGFALVRRVPLPDAAGVRGVAAVPSRGRLYISYGADEGTRYPASVLALDLRTDRILWQRRLDRGVDSLAADASGHRLYVPDGELSSDGVSTVLDGGSGTTLGQITGGTGPHNAVVGASGRWVYLGGRQSRYLDVASTANDRVVRRVGPLQDTVRPFTVNGRETLTYTTATGHLGFQVSSLRSGRVLYTVALPRRFAYDPAHFAPSAPSHGISMSPGERQVWVIDAPNNFVHVFDVSRVPARAPRRIADLRLAHLLQGDEQGCAYDCARDGWLQHSTDGCLVFVGDSGDVFSTSQRRVVGFLPALRQTRKSLEIDWSGDVPIATSTRIGVGRVGAPRSQVGVRCR